jgi:hypothetical protein
MMMLHTKLSRAGCLLPLYSSSATAAFKLCGHVRVNVCRYSSEATTRAKDIFPASSALIDEPVEKIHSHMAKLTANVNKEHKTRGLERFSARLHKELNQDSPSPKINSSVVSTHFYYTLFYVLKFSFSFSLLVTLLNLPIVVALKLALCQVTLKAQ